MCFIIGSRVHIALVNVNAFGAYNQFVQISLYINVYNPLYNLCNV